MSFIDRLLPPIFAAKLKETPPSNKSKGPSPISREKVVPRKKSLKANIQSPKPAPVVQEQPKPLIAFGFWRLATLFGAFLLAGLGQAQWIRNDIPETILKGWWFFGAATILFVVSLLPWKAEELQDTEISPTLEKILVGAILLIAAFFRIFRLDQMPPGVFIDQGICGNIALQILNEHYRPIYADDILRNPPYLMYLLAAWFAVFKATAANFFMFFGVMSVGLVFFVYWTFRQLAGVRTALVAAYILAVMSWNVGFSRNGFPSSEVPFYMFSTMAFLLYGLQNRKRWAFVVSALFFSAGMYTYQAYKIFPALLALFGAYEWFTNRERIKENARHLILFTVMFCVLILPFMYITFHNGNNIWREQNYNLISQIKTEHSLRPAVEMVTRTAKMFNREGDSNERHNLPNHRMLDDITGTLFVLGLFFSITRFKQRKYFFSVVGFGVMCLPCLLSQDPAHANRMLGTTPFIAILAALPLGVVWNRVQIRWGKVGDLVFALLLLEPLFLIGVQNYDYYFVKQANCNNLWTTSIWAGYSVPETRIGQNISKNGDKYDYLISPRFYDYPSINFLAFDQKKFMKRFVMPEDFAPMKSDGNRGEFYFLMREEEGILCILQKLYPTGVLSKEKDLEGNTIVNYFVIPKEAVKAARGLSGTVDGKAEHWPDFPKGLPTGSHRLTVKGCVFVGKADRYTFSSRQPSGLRWHIAGKSIMPDTKLDLACGFYSFDAEWTASNGQPNPALTMVSSTLQTVALNNSNTTSLPLNRGLKGFWYHNSEEKGVPLRIVWNPIINFPHGGDFNFPYDPLFIRWEGNLNAPETGVYYFSAKTDEFASLSIDGKSVFNMSKSPFGQIHLTAGSHTIKFMFKKQLGPILTLFWKTPGKNSSVEIPMDAFGTTQAGL